MVGAEGRLQGASPDPTTGAHDQSLDRYRAAPMAVVIAIDAGTTGVRALAVDETGRSAGWSYREFPQHFPRPGWVEHDPDDIWAAVQTTVGELAGQLAERQISVSAIGITDQRETTVAWDRRTGRPRAMAIVWQDRRTAATCTSLREAGHLQLVRDRTGLVLDPYFSATKMGWLLDAGGVRRDGDLAFGTVDSWIIWNLTGGSVHATDPSNASRTMLYDIGSLNWSDELCDLFDVPRSALPEVRPSSGSFGVTAAGAVAGLDGGIPIGGVAGDQQAALFGQACVRPGMTKNTYGTGSFVLMNVGDVRPDPVDGLLTTVAWTLADGTTSYALEGAIFVTGAAIQWLRDGLGIIDHAAEIGPLASSVAQSDGVVLVPAFTGLGSPWWDPYARGTLLGITRGTGRAHLARAVIEAMAYSTRDVVEAMTRASGRDVVELRVDGGAAVVDLLLQLVADQLGVPVARPQMQETTAVGAAYLAGLAVGVWDDLDEIGRQWAIDAEFRPAAQPDAGDQLYLQWQRAVERARDWAREPPA
ncbi:MAG: glycerol kinase GlpK [Acidimicrobiales bacterium]